MAGCVWPAWGNELVGAGGEHNKFLLQLLDGPSSQPEGFHLFLFLMSISLATLISEDLTCVVTGLMIANGTLTWGQGLGACLSGILVGDFLLYLAGRKMGRPALRKIPLRWMMNPIKLKETEDWFHRRGGMAILVSRFVPGTRLPAYVAAGILGVSYLKFCFFFMVAAVIWTPALLWLSVLLAGKMLFWIERYHHIAPAIVFGALLFYLGIQHLILPAMTWRGRRKLVGRWNRSTRPEYWPMPVLYAPVFIQLVSRWFKPGQHPMDFSACNPCIPGGGMVEESKHAILDQFREREAVAAYMMLAGRLSLEEKVLRSQKFMLEHDLDYPVVLKPDIGQRGNQVTIVKNHEQLVRELDGTRLDMMLQQFIQGTEYGVFYIRKPAEERGYIFAITRKTFGWVTGDGIHHLEDLILKDSRAVCQAKVHFKQFKDRLYEIPDAGKKIQLTNIGNHSRGTMFEDGMGLLTPALENRVDEISKSLPGFYFGRYDLMAPSEEAFQRGEGLKVIELNGVSSEATSMYKPGNSYIAMVRTLWEQWKIASEIGQELQKAGHPKSTLRQLIHDYDVCLRRENSLKLRKFRKKSP